MKNILGDEKECAYHMCHEKSVGLYDTKFNEEDTDDNIYYWCKHHRNNFIEIGYIVRRVVKSHICGLVCKCNAKEAVLL